MTATEHAGNCPAMPGAVAQGAGRMIGTRGRVLLTAIAQNAVVLADFEAMTWQPDPLIDIVGMAQVVTFAPDFPDAQSGRGRRSPAPAEMA